MQMNLPVNPPLLPMLAKRVEELPPGEDWIFEPKWDGFRALVFRDGDEVFIQTVTSPNCWTHCAQRCRPAAFSMERS